MATPTPTPTPGTEGQNLALGLYKLLSPIVEECDAKIQEVMDSQAHLSTQIETLAADLDFFMTFTQTPPLAAHLQRLLNARNRLVTINTTLLTVMTRLDRIAAGVDPQVKERKVSLGSIFKGITTTGSPQKIPPPSPAPPTLDTLSPSQSQQQPTQPQEQPPTQPQETKAADITPNETQETENNETQKVNTSESLP